jgi:hypothetical protein
MSTEDKILSLIKTKGPVLPVDIAGAIESNILLASAHLSELVGRNQLKVSHTKIGGSPVYYLKGQESRLQELSKNLNNKEQRVYSLLKEKKIIKDSDAEPSVRVMLRNIKDFAIPFHVNYNGSKILFWKWYLLGDEEVHKLVENTLKIKKVVKQEKTEVQKENEKIKEEQKQLEEKKIKEKLIEETDRINEEKKKVSKEKERIQKQLEEEKKKIEKEKQNLQKYLEDERRKFEEEKNKQGKEKQKGKEDEQKDWFFTKLKQYFLPNQIRIIESRVLRKGKEIELKIKIPSVVGEVEYYCRAKNKKRISDGDLSSAFVQGQLKRLPTLFLTTGELTKKAKEMLEQDLRSLVVKKL